MRVYERWAMLLTEKQGLDLVGRNVREAGLQLKLSRSRSGRPRERRDLASDVDEVGVR